MQNIRPTNPVHCSRRNPPGVISKGRFHFHSWAAAKPVTVRAAMVVQNLPEGVPAINTDNTGSVANQTITGADNPPVMQANAVYTYQAAAVRKLPQNSGDMPRRNNSRLPSNKQPPERITL